MKVKVIVLYWMDSLRLELPNLASLEGPLGLIISCYSIRVFKMSPHLKVQTLGWTQQNLNLRLSEFGLGAMKVLQSYTIVFAQICSTAAS